jgi:hypothetical protein
VRRLLESRKALFALKVMAAGLLLALAVALIAEALSLEWDCSEGGPHSWMLVGAGLSSASAFLIIFSSRKRWWLYAVSGGVIGFVPAFILVFLGAVGKCAN